MNSVWVCIISLGTLSDVLFSYGVHKKSTYEDGYYYIEDSKGNIYDPEGNYMGKVADLEKYNGHVADYFNYVNANKQKYPGGNYPASKHHAGYDTTKPTTYKHVGTGYNGNAKKYPATAGKNQKGYGGGYSNGNYNKKDKSYKDTSKDYKPGTGYKSKDYHGSPKNTNGYYTTGKPGSKNYKPGTGYKSKNYHGSHKDTNGYYTTGKPTNKYYKPGTGYKSKNYHGSPKDTNGYYTTGKPTNKYYKPGTGYKSKDYHGSPKDTNGYDATYKPTGKDYKPGTNYDSKDYTPYNKDTHGHDATYKPTKKDYKPGNDYDNKDYHGPPKDTNGYGTTYKPTVKDYKPGNDYDSKYDHGTPYNKGKHDHGKTYSGTTETYKETGYKPTVKPPAKYCENGCLDRNVCHELKDVWTIRCNLYQCIWDDKLQKPKLDILFLGCRVKDDSQKCVRPGEKAVFSRKNASCYEFECKCGKRKCNWRKLDAVCEESDGTCHKIGDIFKCKYFEGYTKCECIIYNGDLHIQAYG